MEYISIFPLSNIFSSYVNVDVEDNVGYAAELFMIEPMISGRRFSNDWEKTYSKTVFTMHSLAC